MPVVFESPHKHIVPKLVLELVVVLIEYVSTPPLAPKTVPPVNAGAISLIISVHGGGLLSNATSMNFGCAGVPKYPATALCAPSFFICSCIPVTRTSRLDGWTRDSPPSDSGIERWVPPLSTSASTTPTTPRPRRQRRRSISPCGVCFENVPQEPRLEATVAPSWWSPPDRTAAGSLRNLVPTAR